MQHEDSTTNNCFSPFNRLIIGGHPITQFKPELQQLQIQQQLAELFNQPFHPGVTRDN